MAHLVQSLTATSGSYLCISSKQQCLTLEFLAFISCKARQQQGTKGSYQQIAEIPAIELGALLLHALLQLVCCDCAAVVLVDRLRPALVER